MADFDNLVPAIRQDFDALEAEFLDEAGSVLRSPQAVKKEFMVYAFHQAERETEKWIHCLARRNDLSFKSIPEYERMWQRYNAEAGLVGLPA
jgi:hypothetical protein